MDRSRVVIVMLGLGAVALLAYTAGDAFAFPSLNPPAPDPLSSDPGVGFDPVTGDPIPSQGTTQNAGADVTAAISAMLATIRQFESTNNYNSLVGGGSFSSFDAHPAAPNMPPPIGWRMNTAKTNWYNPATNSSAAGAYQDIYSTWLRLKTKLGLTDFSPASQDAANAELLRETGATFALQSGDLEGAFRLASSQWASLPFSTSGQARKSLPVALATYNNYLTA